MKRKLSVAAFVAAIFFAALGLLLPPMGVIDPSVNMLIAQLLVLCATMLGVKEPLPPPSPSERELCAGGTGEGKD